MTSGMAEASPEPAPTQRLTTPMPCPVCVITLPLDDDPNIGTVHWKIPLAGRLRIGVAVRFECPNGHTSDDDPTALKAFRSRRFEPAAEQDGPPATRDEDLDGFSKQVDPPGRLALLKGRRRP